MSNAFPLRAAMLASVAALFSACGIVLLKLGMNSGGTLRLIPLLVGLVVYATGVLLGMLLVAKYSLSVTYSVIVGLSLAFLGVISTLWLGEVLTARKVAGTVTIVLGVVMLVRSGTRKVSG
jgi:multidrug transporter EmrE-like cation transporter